VDEVALIRDTISHYAPVLIAPLSIQIRRARPEKIVGAPTCVDAELRHRGIVVNAKKVRRLMREHALNPKQRRRFIATTDSDHNYPIFPDLAKNMKLDGPNQLWVADITYVTIATGFVYLAAILDAWSRRVVGYHPVIGFALPFYKWLRIRRIDQLHRALGSLEHPLTKATEVAQKQQADIVAKR
jgi:transposase InsO family protein